MVAHKRVGLFMVDANINNRTICLKEGAQDNFCRIISDISDVYLGKYNMKAKAT